MWGGLGRAGGWSGAVRGVWRVFWGAVGLEVLDCGKDAGGCGVDLKALRRDRGFGREDRCREDGARSGGTNMVLERLTARSNNHDAMIVIWYLG